MDDGELEFSNQDMLSSPCIGNFPDSGSMGSFWNDILGDTHACTHTHTCNPPGPDNSHTHTCYHVHTKIVPAPSEEDKAPSDDTAESADKKSKKRPSGNREAVRKYREKKKARAASLEDEVVRLRAINQQLLKRVQGQALLEAEVARLKCLLVDIRGRIEGEIGSFPYQKPAMANHTLPGSYVMNPCNMHCDDQVYCLHPGSEGKSSEGVTLNTQDISNCEFESLQCLGNQYSGLNELPVCGVENSMPTRNTSGKIKKKAMAQAAASS
ncbi:unnamed protein product [Cuscuta campestris]|uniref:BZIP domain-containing protein n=1 Tax=Cuscuta campestris TaxID=132261 RepID=A0A484LPM2_9ASTE|nr:unnamed protein product [Cuscuta campestris]